MTTTQTQSIEHQIDVLDAQIEELRADLQSTQERDLPTGHIRREIADCIEQINELEAMFK